MSSDCTRRHVASRKLTELRNKNPRELSRRNCPCPRRLIPLFYGFSQPPGVDIEFSRRYFGNQAMVYFRTRAKGGVVTDVHIGEGSMRRLSLHLELHWVTVSLTFERILPTTRSSCYRNPGQLFPTIRTSHGERSSVASGKNPCKRI